MLNKDSKENTRDPLKEHKLAKIIGKDKGNVLLLKGYMGKSDTEDTIRLYLDLNFDEYVDIPQTDILYSADAPENVLEFGGTYMWISKDTNVKYVRIEATEQKASMLSEVISKRSLQYKPFRHHLIRIPPPYSGDERRSVLFRQRI